MGRDIRFIAWVLLVVLCAICLAEMVRAEAAPRGAVQSRRLVHLFDFEETIEGAPLGQFERLPLYWYVMGRPEASSDPNFIRQPVHQELMHLPGYSRHNSVGFDTREKTSGQYSLHLGLDNGSVGAFLQIGAVPAMPDIDYLIQLNVRTGVLKHASARIVAYFVDGKGERIESSVVHSDLIRTDNAWKPVELRLVGKHTDVAWIGMQLELVQGQRDERSLLGDRQIVYQQVRGEAWFDDIAIWQLPYLQMRTQSRVNVIRSPHQPVLSFEVRDLTGQPLLAEVTVFDHTFASVASLRRRVGAGEPSQWLWRPKLDRFGWYLVEMRIGAADPSISPDHANAERSFVARTRMALLYLDGDRALDGHEAGRFALCAEDLPAEELALVPLLMDGAGVHGLVASLWDRQTTLDNIHLRHTLLERVVQDVVSRSGRVTLSMHPIPDVLAGPLGISDDMPLGLFAADVDATQWNGYLTALTLRLGERVRQWQLGPSAQSRTFHEAQSPDMTDAAVRTFTTVAPQPQMTVPWRITQSRRDEMPRGLTYALHVPTSVQPADFIQYLHHWQADPSTRVRLDLDVLPATHFQHADRINDLVLRMLYGWEAGASGITINRPWTLADDRQLHLTPDPLLGVFSTVAHRLAGRRVVARLPLSEGVEAMILAGESDGAIVAWNRAAPQDQAHIDMFLGGQPYIVDVFNNRQAVAMSQGRHQLTLSNTPIFIEGIDVELALFRALFRIDEPFIASRHQVHRRTLTIHNPWSHTISGQMRLTEPADWDIQPRITQFSIPAGESRTIPLDIQFPVSETAGVKQLVAAFEFTADEHYTVDVAAPLEIGLEDVDVDAHVMLINNPETGQTDARVVQRITNRTDKPMTIYAFAHLQGFARQERLITRLEPGQSVIRRFTFANGADAALQHAVRAGIRQANGPVTLTYKLKPGTR